MRVIILLLVWALSGQVVPPAPPRDSPQPRDGPQGDRSATISGRVYSAASGAPLRGALVFLAPADTIERSSLQFPGPSGGRPGAVTDAAGRFRITAVAPGVYRLVANPPRNAGQYLPAGHGAARANDAGRRITIAAGDDIRNADIALPSGAAIEGRVVDEAGEPQTRMAVYAARLMAGSDVPQRGGHAPASTDDLGRYRIYGLEPGTYVVAASTELLMPIGEDYRFYLPYRTSGPGESESFTTTFHPSTVVDGQAQRIRVGAQDVTGIDITAIRVRRFRLSGTIVDSQGNAAARTSGIVKREGLLSVSNRPFQTDAQGKFTLPALEPGAYRVLVGGGLGPSLSSVNGRTEFADVLIEVNGDSDGLVIVTQPGIGLAGRIVFSEGAPSPVPSMRIVFRRADEPSPGEIFATFDDHERFFGSDVFGPLLVRVTSPPMGWIVKEVTLGGADITDVPTVFRREHDGQLQVVLTSRPAAIEGEVRGESGPAADEATVYVFSEDRRSWSLSSPRTVSSQMRENGRFAVEGLAPGRYYAIAIARDGFRMPLKAGEAFFELLSKEATPFVIGDDERRTVNLTLWRWPE